MNLKKSLLLLSATSLTAYGDQLITPNALTVNAGSEFFPAANLINDSGLSAIPTIADYTTVTHANASDTTAWTTDAPNGDEDYYLVNNEGPTPVFVLELDAATPLRSLVYWGYHFGASNGNETREFLVEFSEDEGATYPNMVTVSTDLSDFATANAKILDFGAVFLADTVRISLTDNHFGGTAAGGDRMGLGEIKFIAPSDPSVSFDGPVTLQSNGAPESGSVTITNRGETQDLTITGVTVEGANADLFTITSTFPLTITPDATGEIIFDFDPNGALDNTVEAQFRIASNDSDAPEVLIPVTGAIRDPWIEVSILPDFGQVSQGAALAPATVTITNLGSSEDLIINGSNFETNPLSVFGIQDLAATPLIIEAGEAVTVDLTFNPANRIGGTYEGLLSLLTNDPEANSLTFSLSADLEKDPSGGPLIAWWPLDANSADESGNGFNGIDNGSPNFSALGANTNTGTSAAFDGTNSIDIPLSDYLNPDSFTVTLWANPDTGTNFQSLITSRADRFGIDGRTYGFVLYNSIDGDWEFWSGNNDPSAAGWQTAQDPTNDVLVGEWSHLAITYDAATQTKTSYLNGAVLATQVVEVSRNLVADLHLASGGDLGDEFFFQGRLDDVAIFCEALPEAAINSIMTDGVANYALGGTGIRITEIETDGGNFLITGTSGLRTATDYHIETSPDLINYTDFPGSTFEKEDDVPLIPLGEVKLFVRIVEGPSDQ